MFDWRTAVVNSVCPVVSRHLKSNDDEHSLSPSSSNGKAPRLSKGTESETSKRKRPINSTAVSGRGRKIQRKIPEDKADSMDENVSEFDSDLSNEDSNAVKRASHSTKAYHATLEELHQAAGRYPQANDNQRFNNRSMTKLTDENLHLQHFRDCLGEQEDRQFFNSINTYLDQFRQRLFAYFNYMKSSTYREHIKQQLDNEMELNKTLKAKVHCLENNIKTLLEDAIDLLKLRTNELGVEELERPAQLITYANDISNKHKELRSKVASLEKEIAEYDQENDKLSFILTNIQTNGHRSTSSSSSPPLPSSSGLHSSNDNVYSTLLASMSRQTQQQEKHHPSNAFCPSSSWRSMFCLSSRHSFVWRDEGGREVGFCYSETNKEKFGDAERWSYSRLANQNHQSQQQTSESTESGRLTFVLSYNRTDGHQ